MKFLEFLVNLFKPKATPGKQVIKEDGLEIILNKSEGTMIINTDRDLTNEDIKDLMRKYLG